MEEEGCVHGLGEPAWCVLCNGRERREAKAEALRKAEAKVPFWLFKKGPGPRRESWASGNRIDDRLIQRGGMIDERSGPRRSEQRPRAARRIEGFVK